MNPEKISEFLHRMKVDKIFRSYYHGLYDSLCLLYRRIFDKPSLVVVQSEKQWTWRIDKYSRKDKVLWNLVRRRV